MQLPCPSVVLVEGQEQPGRLDPTQYAGQMVLLELTSEDLAGRSPVGAWTLAPGEWSVMPRRV